MIPLIALVALAVAGDLERPSAPTQQAAAQAERNATLGDRLAAIVAQRVADGLDPVTGRPTAPETCDPVAEASADTGGAEVPPPPPPSE